MNEARSGLDRVSDVVAILRDLILILFLGIGVLGLVLFLILV